jgi:glutamyl-tRNA synthetase
VCPQVDDLKALKAEYETITGEAWPTPAPPTKKKKQPGPPSQPKSREGIPAGMSKNEAKKAARKAAAAAAKKEKYGDAAGKLKTAAVGPPPSIANPAASGKSVPTLQVLWCGAPGAAPCVALLAHEFSGAKNISFAQSQGSETAIGSVFACSSPTLIFPDGQTLTGDLNIARYIARANSKQLYGTDFLQASLVDQWLEYLQNAALQGDFQGIVRTLDSHLATAKGFLVGSAVTLADMAAWCILQGNGVAPAQGFAQKWYGQCNALRPFQLVNTKLLGGSPAPAAAAKKSTGSSVGTFVELPGVTDPTKIVTRFPPEPSGYLHIGHAKACMLNNYFAHTKYQGQLLVRFDDTNPSKEKEEFEEAIQHDLATMGIKPDKIVHTSDHFELIQKHLETLLESGNAYIDNTPVEQMREERFEGIESKCRAHSVKENQRLWAAMKKGTTEGLACCARMKMDMKCLNKCLRDPALYRCNLTPHARTKTKYKVYPTYDFACPIVDTEDGVTHALRDRQYIDRDPMYEYFQQVMGLRKVHIWEFARLNFMQCILSKRKIQWFVDEGIVTGWDDPRVPSIQGIMRRGLTIEALQEYILSQGASKNIVNHSWDKIWTINKKMIDPVVPRYTALASEGLTKLTVVDGPEEVVFKRMPKHPKNPEVGNKITRVYKDILIEGVDAAAAGPTEEVTLMGWGNVILSGKQGDVLQAKCNPDGSFKGTQKFTWLADIDDLVPVTLVTLDHLVTKDFDDSQESFKEFVNPPESTWIEEAAFADPNVRNVKQGELVQFERKGYYRCDKPYVGGAAPAVFFLIPDGREKKPAAKKVR